MKNKYILLALLPILSAGNIFCAQAANAVVTAWQAMQNPNFQGVPSIKQTMQALVAYAAVNDAQATTSINQINNIKSVLERNKIAHYNGTLMSNAYWFFDIEPNNAVTSINNDLKEIKEAFEAINDKKWRKFNTDASRMLSITANRTMYLAGGALLGACAFYCYMNKADINKFSFWKSHILSFNSISTATTNVAAPIIEQVSETPGLLAGIFTTIYNNKIKFIAGATTVTLAGAEVATNGGISTIFTNTTRQIRAILNI